VDDDSKVRAPVSTGVRAPIGTGLGLCLSGGGYRAALLHLGAIRRLNELGLLGHVDTVSSVSGGSIVAAHLALAVRPWPEPGVPFAEFENDVVQPLRKLMKTDIRTWPVMSRLLPWNWFRTDNGARQLAKQYDHLLTNGATWNVLADFPRFVLSATDMVFGTEWIFDTHTPVDDTGNGTVFERRARTGSSQVGYRPLGESEPLSIAVAASSCFPPIFNPFRGRCDPATFVGGEYLAAENPNRDRLVKAVAWSDGGLYDNLGLDPVWTTHSKLAVSDGGAVFKREVATWLIARLFRYIDIGGNGGAEMRKRLLASNSDFTAAYWSLDSDIAELEHPGEFSYSKGLVHEVIESIRTDLDDFGDHEQAVLENHGYALANAKVREYLKDLQPAVQAPFALPFPGETDEKVVRHELRHSSRHSFFGVRW